MYRYAQIARELRARIARGEYATGRLPAERTLGQEFGVQRDTIRQALDVLTQQRVLLRDSTRGTYLSPEFIRANPTLDPNGDNGVGGRALLIVPAFDDTLAPSLVLQGMTQRMGEVHIPVSWYDSGTWEAPHSSEKPYLPTRDARTDLQVRGAVLWPTLPISLEELQAFQSETPLVLIDRRVPGLEADYVGFQDREGGLRITEHLLRCGHWRIGFASGEPQASTVQARRDGYKEALQSAGITPDSAWEIHQKGGTKLISTERMDAYLNQNGNPLTAVVCANDVVAGNIIQHVRRLRRQVPEDVAVTGFGDLAPSMMEAFGVTTVAQPFREMGRVAGDLLVRRWSGAVSTGEHTEIELPMEIIVRVSCGSRK